MKIKLLALAILGNLPFWLNAQEIINPGFEFPDTQSTTLAKSWHSMTQDGTISVDSVTKFSGKYSMRITSDNYGSYFRQSIEYKSDSFEKYRLSSWIKRDSIVDDALVLVKINNKDEKPEFLSMNKNHIDESQGWKNFVCEFYLDGTQDDIEIVGYVRGKGTAWFDDFNLEKINETAEASRIAIEYMKEALEIVEENSIMIDSIDFYVIKERCLSNINGMQTESDCYPMIRYLLKKLGDDHSQLMPPNKAEEYRTNTAIEKAAGKIIREKYAYINVPGVGTVDSAAMSNFATELQDLIEELDSVSPKGWIVDLRDNSGGNCWPMLAGIGPLIGEGVCCYFFDSKDSSFVASYRQGVSYLDEQPLTAIARKHYTLNNQVPIAVLIGPETASSGEVVAISFIGKPNCKLFGEPSDGLTTGNAMFALNDGASIVLTTLVDADRNGKKYRGKIQPDYPVSFSDSSYDEDNDPVIGAAIYWINNDNK